MLEKDETTLHPILNYLKSRIESLLTLVQLEKDRQPVEPDSFRLKNLSSWTFENYKSVFEALGSFSGLCNLDCIFCYEKGNPIPYEKSLLSLKEAKTRIRHYRSKDRKGLPLFKERLYKEPFTNKNLLSILKMVRGADPETIIELTTNGSSLNEALLEELARLIPIHISISVNVSNSQRRAVIMGDHNSAESIEIIKKFKQYGLAFYGSIVAWPTLDIKEVIETIYFLDKNFARIIRVNLPGYSKFYSHKGLLNRRETWDKIVENILPLRQKVKTPLIVLPALYHSEAFLPKIEGVIQNSPADRENLKPGDVIKKINGRSIFFRTELRELLSQESAKCSIIEIDGERNGKKFSARLRESGGNDESYPYRLKGYPLPRSYPYGIVIIDDFNPAWLWNLLHKVSETDAKHILLMTSEIMEPLIAFLLGIHPDVEALLKDRNLYLWIPVHRFWGGNIIMGDLYTCSDYLHAIWDFQKERKIRPDLVVIPSSFSSNRNTDLLGVPYSSIENITGVPIQLAVCSPIQI